MDNTQAFFDYHNEERNEAGLLLAGWEVTALRAGRGQPKEGADVAQPAEICLIGTLSRRLPDASPHSQP
ncbi:SsrA-binding protein, partial [Burkholderia pseudomallei]